jgi:hypothetical protein
MAATAWSAFLNTSLEVHGFSVYMKTSAIMTL